jgi:uncharacterized protein (DUF1778 family)
MRLGRFSRIRKLIRQLSLLEETGDPLEEFEEPVVLEPNDRKEYVLRAKVLNDSTRRSFTYVYAAEISKRVVARRARMNVDVESWDNFA